MELEETLFETAGEESADELKVDPNNIGQAVIWGTDWTTETINMQMVKGNIDLNPKFQRRDAWNNQEKSCLIESLMLGMPVPQIILAENKERRNSYIVLDGKQRLLSIRRFYAEKNQDEKEETFTPLKLSGLTILKNLNGKFKSNIENEYITNLENQSIRTIIIKNWPSEAFLYAIFLRLNTGSKKLSPQELRQALKPGEFLTFLDDKTAGSLIMHKMLGIKDADPRMRDIELALRYYAFKYYIEDFDGNLKEFLDISCGYLNKRWTTDQSVFESDFVDLEDSIEFAYMLIGNNSPFSRYGKENSANRFNRSIYELLTYYFSSRILRDKISQQKELFLSSFAELNDNPDFISAVSDTTKSPIKVVTRFKLFAKLLARICKMEIKSLDLIQGKIKKVLVGE